MKKLIIILLLLFSTSCMSQKQCVAEYSIKSKKERKAINKHLKGVKANQRSYNR
jgi:hypothetical protein